MNDLDKKLKIARQKLDEEWDTLDYNQDYYLPEDLKRLREKLIERDAELKIFEKKQK